MNGIWKISVVLAFSSVLIAGCDRADDNVETTVEVTAVPVSIYQAAVDHPSRSDADRESDFARKPADVLAFMGIEPGMSVLDLFSGGGWYAEILALTVGDSGRVTAHTNTAYINYIGDVLEQRFASDRVANVDIIHAENNELNLEENSFDAVMMAQSFHDIYHVDEENHWFKLDGPELLAELRKGLKPGGIVAIIDHAALPGAPASSGDELHRIDPAIVVADMEAAGFICEDTSDLLHNPDDDLTVSVFSDGIRGKTSRFIMRFRNPE